VPQTSASGQGFDRVLVAVHRSATDESLLAYAAMLARAGLVREARFVHVRPPVDPAKSNPEFEPTVADMKAAADRHFAGAAAAVPRHYELPHGPLLDQLLAYAGEQQTDLILVGHRRDHPLRRSLARRLATKAPCSVWLVPDGSPPALRRVLVPIDFSPRSADALVQACVLAARVGLPAVHALHVYFDATRTTYDEADAVIRGHEADTFRRFLAPLNTHGVAVTPHFESGSHPAHTIVRVAADIGADLIVMETRGRTASAAILLGSVAEETLIESRVPVLVVKHFGARLGVLQALLDRTFRRGSGLQFD
jgi:nucleotide-binding universal stress UspA family protein